MTTQERQDHIRKRLDHLSVTGVTVVFTGDRWQINKVDLADKTSHYVLSYTPNDDHVLFYMTQNPPDVGILNWVMNHDKSYPAMVQLLTDHYYSSEMTNRVLDRSTLKQVVEAAYDKWFGQTHYKIPWRGMDKPEDLDTLVEIPYHCVSRMLDTCSASGLVNPGTALERDLLMAEQSVNDSLKRNKVKLRKW